jgi:hypothetical protein
MGYLVAATFFARFHRRSGDRLFLWFALAFGLLAFQRIALAVTTGWIENVTWLYVLRLAAFVLIIAAIIDKNRTSA